MLRTVAGLEEMGASAVDRFMEESRREENYFRYARTFAEIPLYVRSPEDWQQHPQGAR